MDTFEMAMTAVRSADAGSIDSLKMGIEMISNQLKTVLSEEGLEEINAADQVFDPAIHEAVSKEAREDVEEGRILSQTRKGYKLKIG
jgi:molecular chaperone GrpE